MTVTAHTSASTVTGGPRPDLTAYDLIVIGLSGKDGHAALEVTLGQAREAGVAGVADRVYTVHADLGDIEWPPVAHRGRYYPDNRELVQITATRYSIPTARQILTRRVVTDPAGRRQAHSLLAYVAARGKWPDINARFCTSDMKTGKIRVALTPHIRHRRRFLNRPVRILNVTGLRAAESARRRNLAVYSASSVNGSRHIDDYLPVHELSTQDVRDLVDASGIGHHWAYDSQPGAHDWRGSSRLSCSFCVLSNRDDLVLAAQRRPRLARLYAEVEDRISHQFRADYSMRQIITWAAHNRRDPGVIVDEDTPAFAALAAAVRAQLTGSAPLLRGDTEFTPNPVCFPGCPSGCH
jgi:3'-phosphoadenosine 5'-phosphosulfate sulfotransferase (PAPS reductase)/FAD synthetase